MVRIGIALTAIVLLVAGCTSHSQGSAQPSAAQIEHDIQRTDLTNPTTLHALDIDTGTTNGATAARTILAGTPGAAATWGAVYVYLGSGTDPAPLRHLLTDAHLDVRAMAAAGLVVDGDAGGFPVLIDALGHDDLMRGSRPPLMLWQFAAQTLARVTGKTDLGPSSDAPSAQVAAAHARWQTWWTGNKATLAWSAGDQMWTSR